MNKEIYWNLSQATAWVVFRDLRAVGLFAPPDPESWSAFLAYRRTTQSTDGAGKAFDVTNLEEHGNVSLLFEALRSGQLIASGLRPEPDNLIQGIPKIDWQALVGDVDGPYQRLPNCGKSEPWRAIVVRRADVERLWRSPTEIADRSKFDKGWFKANFGELKKLHNNFSDNRIIEELQLKFPEETGKESPSRPTIQRYIKSP